MDDHSVVWLSVNVGFYAYCVVPRTRLSKVYPIASSIAEVPVATNDSSSSSSSMKSASVIVVFM